MPDVSHPNLWVGSLYFAASLPNVVVGEVSKFFYNDLGLPVAELSVLTGSMYLPWVIKPLWSPLVDHLRSKRWWIVLTQAVLAFSFLALALSAQTRDWVRWSAAAFWLMAFASATHDVACDGFYMLGLTEADQARLNGFRTVAYRVAAILGKGGLVILAGFLATHAFTRRGGWGLAFLAPAAYLACSAGWHRGELPRPASDGPVVETGFLGSLTAFMSKPGLGVALLFTLLFRFGEGQMLAVAAPFLTGSRSQGCIGLTTVEVGWAYGTWGTLGAIVGGVIGSWAVARWGLRRAFWPMIAATHLPDVAFTWMAFAQPSSRLALCAAIFTEQLGFNFGFTVYMLFLMYFARGPHRTSHFAFCTGLMALGGMLPQMLAGPVESVLGFQRFYVYVLVCTLPGFWVAVLGSKLPGFLDAYSAPREP